MCKENQSPDPELYEKKESMKTQFDEVSHNAGSQFVTLEISKSVHSRLLRYLSRDQKNNALYNLDKCLHQILDKLDQDVLQQRVPSSAREPFVRSIHSLP